MLPQRNKRGKVMSIVHRNVEGSRDVRVSSARSQQTEELVWDVRNRRTCIRSSRGAGVGAQLSSYRVHNLESREE